MRLSMGLTVSSSGPAPFTFIRFHHNIRGLATRPTVLFRNCETIIALDKPDKFNIPFELERRLAILSPGQATNQ
jgi:hypothetical protein